MLSYLYLTTDLGGMSPTSCLHDMHYQRGFGLSSHLIHRARGLVAKSRSLDKPSVLGASKGGWRELWLVEDCEEYVWNDMCGKFWGKNEATIEEMIKRQEAYPNFPNYSGCATNGSTKIIACVYMYWKGQDLCIA